MGVNNTKSKLCIHKQIYQETCTLYRIKLEKSKEEYFRSKLLEADPMVFFKVIDKLFRTTSKPILPSRSTAVELAIKFSNCFVEKIRNLIDEIAENNSLSLSVDVAFQCVSIPESFTNVSCDEVKTVIINLHPNLVAWILFQRLF